VEPAALLIPRRSLSIAPSSLGSSAARRPDVRVPRRELSLDLANLSDRGHSPFLSGKLPRTVLRSLPLLLGATMATIRPQGPSSASRCWPCPPCYRHQFTGPPGCRRSRGLWAPSCPSMAPASVAMATTAYK
jgi:hypothetical protein